MTDTKNIGKKNKENDKKERVLLEAARHASESKKGRKPELELLLGCTRIACLSH